MPQQNQFDTVDHPVLGRLTFPKDMPFDERNESIEEQLKLHHARLEQQQLMDSATHMGASGVHPSFPSFGTGYIPRPQNPMTRQQPSFLDQQVAQEPKVGPNEPQFVQPTSNSFGSRIGAAMANQAAGEYAASKSNYERFENPVPGLKQFGSAAGTIAKYGGNVSPDVYSNFLEGGFGALKPLITASYGFNPMGVSRGLGMAMGLQMGVSSGMSAMGFSPEASRLGGNIGALSGGLLEGGKETYDYLRGRRYAQQLRGMGLPEDEVLTRVANPPWKQGGIPAPVVPPNANPLLRPVEQPELPQQKPIVTPMPRPIEAAPMVPPKPAEGSMTPLGNQPIIEKPPMMPPRNATASDIPTGPPQDLMGPGDRGLGGKQRYEQIDELMQHMSDSLPPSLFDKVKDHLFIDSNPDGSVGYYVTPREEGGPHLSDDEHDILQGAVEEYTNANLLDAARGQRASETPQEQVERVEREQAERPYDRLANEQFDKNYEDLTEAQKNSIDKDVVGLSKLSDYDRATLESHNAAMAAPPVKDVLPLKLDDLKTPSPAGPRSPAEPTPQGQAPSTSRSTKSLPETDKANLKLAHDYEGIAAAKGWHEGIEPLREAVRNLKINGSDSLFVYQSAMQKFVSGMRSGDKWALKKSLDYIASKKPSSELHMELPGWRSVQQLFSRYKPGTPEYDANAKAVASGLHESARRATADVSPHVGGLRFDGWSFGDPFTKGGAASYGAPMNVNVTHLGTGGTFSVPVSVASDPALLHTFVSQALKPFGVEVKARVAAAGADGLNMGLFPADSIEAALRAMRVPAKGVLSALDRMGLEEPPGGAPSVRTTARAIMRQNIGKLYRQKEQLYKKFDTPEIDPSTLSATSRTYESAKEFFGARLGIHGMLQSAISRHDSNGPTEFRSWTSAMESGNVAALSPADRVVASQLRAMLDDRWDKIETIRPNIARLDAHGDVNPSSIWIEDYFPHIWKNVGRATDFARQVLGARKPLAGPGTFLKERFYGTIEEGMDAKLEPVTYNPIRMGIIRLHEMDRFIMAHTIKDQLAKAGIAKWVRGFNRPPDGYVALNDRVFRGTKIGEDGIPDLNGNWFAPVEAAEPLNNYLSPGLRGKKLLNSNLPAYDFVRAYGNMLNQAQLGLSPFHLFFTSLDAMTSTSALGMEQMERGLGMGGSGFSLRYTLQGAGNIAKAAGSTLLTPLDAATIALSGKRLGGFSSPGSAFLRGNKVMSEYLEPGKYQQYSWLADQVANVDGRVAIDPFYKNFQIDRMWDSFHKGLDEFKAGNVKEGLKASGKAAARLPFASVEYMAKPIMEYIVPRMKLGVFADMAAHAHERYINGELDQTQLRKVLNDSWDSVDNRMGQLVYDNLFWNRALKDTLMLSIRSVGWNIGTFRELGGAAKDVATAGIKVAAGEKAEISRRFNYALSLAAVSALIGGTINYVYTGQFPHNLDYWAPRTGRLDEGGKPERVMFPSYIRDVLAFKHEMSTEPTGIPWRTITNKLHPWIQQWNDLLHNEDFWGREIIHPGDPMTKRAAEAAKYILGSFEPLSWQATAERKRLGASSAEAAATYGALMPAPKYLGMTAGEERAYQISRSHMERGPKTSAAWQHGQTIQTLRNQVSMDMQAHGGKLSPDGLKTLHSAISAGTITGRQADSIWRSAKMKPLQRYFQHMTAGEAYEVWNLLTPKEQQLVLPQFLHKFSSIRNEPIENQQFLRDGYSSVIKSNQSAAQQVLKERDLRESQGLPPNPDEQ